MGYYIRSLSNKKSSPSWKLQYVSYKNADTQNSKAKSPKKEWDIAEKRWRTLGFHTSMSLADARCRAKQLNAQAQIKRQEEKIREIELKESDFQIKHDACLPVEFVHEFEKHFIRVRDSETEKGKRKKSRALIQWSAAQQMIVALQIDPSEWFYYIQEIYDYFYRKKYSLRYIYSILNIANVWGFFISRKLNKPFLPVPKPRGYERQRLIEAYYNKEKYGRRPSKPLLPEQLLELKGKLNQQNFNWLFLTVWFGLRPQEVDNILNDDFWFCETLSNGRKVLSVFQTKIIALPPEDRWKPIPILFEEQEFALQIIKSKKFKRPLIKTMKKYFGKGLDNYGGRKGFVDLMLSKGQSMENISIWMGHSTLDRTWRSYKNKKRFHLHR